MNYSVSAVGALVIMLQWIRSHLLIQHQQDPQTTQGHAAFIEAHPSSTEALIHG